MTLWKYLPAKLSHQLAPWGLAVYASIFGNPTPIWRDFTWRGIYFPNPLGVAGGVDKNAKQILDWQDVGAGFVEVGTITPKPQTVNPGKILDRRWDEKILWNKMGFPNQGSDLVLSNLQNEIQDLQIPLFVNIGKNRDTANELAIQDYVTLAKKFSGLAKTLVVNVSSPNTKGLRDLQNKNELQSLVSAVVQNAQRTPVLVKLSPDLSQDDLKMALDSSLEAGALGFILTNTTLARPEKCDLPVEGGVSGKFLADKAKKSLQQAVEHLGPLKNELLIVSAGGVLSAQEVQERLQLGANLVQVYSALVFHGPNFFNHTAQYMLEKKPGDFKI